MSDYTNGMNGDSPHELERMTARIAGDSEIHDLIGETVQKTVSQYHSLLRKGLEQEVERILHEFTSATADIELIVTKRVKSRLHDIVREEVQRIFDAALSATNESIFGSMESPVPVNEPETLDSVVQQFEEVLPKPTSQAPIEVEAAETAPHEDVGDIHDVGLNESIVEDDEPPSDDEVSQDIDDYSESEEPPVSYKEADSSENEYQQTNDFDDEDDDDEDEQLPDWNPVELSLGSSVDVQQAAEDTEVADFDEERFEGTVRLNVEANDCIGEVVHFVRELRQKPQLRLLRMVGNNKDGVDIWLGLREPLQLRKMLPQIEGVSVVSRAVEEDPSKERVLSVRLEPRVLEETTATSEA